MPRLTTWLWRSIFYKQKTDKHVRPGRVQFRKSLPANIKDYLWGDLALAIFYLDDGWYDWEKKTDGKPYSEIVRFSVYNSFFNR
jgi:hypothetical protein